MHVRVLVLSVTAAGLVAVAGCGGRGIGPSVTPEKARQAIPSSSLFLVETKE